MADVVTSAVRVVVVVLVGGGGGSGSKFDGLESFFLILGMLLNVCMPERGVAQMFDYLSITTFNRCCVECAGVRVRGVHCTSNFSLMISKIEAPAADDAPL